MATETHRQTASLATAQTIYCMGTLEMIRSVATLVMILLLVGMEMITSQVETAQTP